ncbi:MAG: RNA-binding S4 domain-containing protein [Saprospiraceae bacterium]|nr:RNA-binding S4 domain-containing protein [Saprospiraceae bacterium]
MEKMRIDKWVWAVRIYKSRTIAADACKSGKIRLNGNVAKPSALVAENDKIEVKKNGFNLEFKVIKLLKSRVGAAIAVECYENITPQEEMNKYKNWFMGKAQPELRERGTGRPTKKERREIDDFKDSDNPFDWWDEEEEEI